MQGLGEAVQLARGIHLGLPGTVCACARAVCVETRECVRPCTIAAQPANAGQRRKGQSAMQAIGGAPGMES